MTNKNNTLLLIFATLIFGVGIVGFLVQKDAPNAPVSETREDEEKLLLTENAPKRENEKTSVNISSLETGEDIPAGISPQSDIPAPDPDRPIIFDGEFTEEQKEKITLEIKGITASLKEDSELFNDWLDLGLLRKVIGDYEGARQAWEYASTIRPHNSLSFVNLGMLYGYYLASPAKAEANFLQAIDNAPKLTYLYSQSADFYVEVMKNIEKAKDILRQGLAENPLEEGLRVQLESL